MQFYTHQRFLSSAIYIVKWGSMISVKKYKSTSTGTRKLILKLLADELSTKSTRWKSLFEIARLDGTDSWRVVELLYQQDSGTNLDQINFSLARAAKLLAVTESIEVSNSLTTKNDLVNWNRQAVLAMIESVKQQGFDRDKITRGHTALEIINRLFPDYLP